MSDRCYCSLRVSGRLTTAEAERLFTAIDDSRPSVPVEPVDASNINNCIGFEEVNYGNIDRVGRLRKTLEELNLSFAWYNGSGGDYPEGVLLYNAATSEKAEYSTCECEIVITLNQANDPVHLARANAWADFEGALKLEIVP